MYKVGDKVVAYGMVTHITEVIEPYPEAFDQTNQYRTLYWSGYFWEHELTKIDDIEIGANE